MNMDKKLDGERLELILHGRLDTNTAPDLEKELLEMVDIKQLVLNLADLEYISSAGLRVVLMANKKIRAVAGTMVVKKPNDMVMEIFDMTGFTEILKFEK